MKAWVNLLEVLGKSTFNSLFLPSLSEYVLSDGVASCLLPSNHSASRQATLNLFGPKCS